MCRAVPRAVSFSLIYKTRDRVSLLCVCVCSEQWTPSPMPSAVPTPLLKGGEGRFGVLGHGEEEMQWMWFVWAKSVQRWVFPEHRGIFEVRWARSVSGRRPTSVSEQLLGRYDWHLLVPMCEKRRGWSCEWAPRQRFQGGFSSGGQVIGRRSEVLVEIASRDELGFWMRGIWRWSDQWPWNKFY